VIEAGVQLHLPTYRGHSLSRLMDIARAAESAGLQQIWITDNLECRDTFVVLAGMATLKVKLGTAIMAQYFRSPVRAANCMVPLSELMDGRELTIGIGTGNPLTGRQISMPRPVGFMRQYVGCLNRLLAGEEASIADYPLLAEYFRFEPGAVLSAPERGPGPIRLYGGGNGPMGLALAGELMDGLLFGWTTLHNIRMGRLDEKLAIADSAAEKAGKAGSFGKVTELKVSIAEDHAAARDYVRHEPSCARRTMGLRRRGYTDDDICALGIEPADVDRLIARVNSHGPYADFSDIVTDAMIDASYVAGDPVYCRERLAEHAALVARHGFGQIIFSELGPDQIAAIRLLSEHVLPVLAGTD
jgi:alkanesulfonate monooxygenase SsuD/methylene tetrahydromethanopterin reductase-like flavin-dependent oxidoreductase (luciferase family)